MTLTQALNDPRVMSGEAWFRPVTHEGCASAYSINQREGIVELVPSLFGGTPAHLNKVRDLLGDWAVVEPSLVLEEAQPPQAMYS